MAGERLELLGRLAPRGHRWLFAAASLLGAPASVVAQRAQLTFAPELFRSDRGDTVTAERGRLTVPERWEPAGGATIELQFVRFKSTSANPGPPIVYLAGGPGGSGIGAARSARFPLFMALRRVGDVIAFDQRGTGVSKPSLLCPEPWSYPTDRPGRPDEVLESLRVYSRGCAAHLARSGIDVAAYHTNASADDLDALRQALGVDRISLLGISYGTHLGLATLRRHPNRIHRAILAGVEGPDHTVKLPSVIDRHVLIIDSLARLDTALTRMVPDFAGLVRSVLARLDQAPVTVELPGTGGPRVVVVSKFDLQRTTAAGFGSSQAIGGLPALYYRLSRGDFSAVARGLVQERTSQRYSAMPFAMDCASGASPERQARFAQESLTSLLGGWVDFPFLGICTAWPHRDLGPEFRSPVRSALPTLFISGTLDGRTPPGNAEEVRQGFSRSEHLVLEGASHSDDLLISAPEIATTMVAFLLGHPVPTTRLTVPFRFQVPNPSPGDGRGSQ